MEIQFQRVPTNGIHLHVAEAGPKSGPLVILLHGFPEFWHGWRKQIEALAQLGFHVVAPDQRGYNLSDKPKSISNYRIDVLTKDILSLKDHFAVKKFSLVGHDWGGAVAWHFAHQYPEHLEKLIMLNSPHPRAMLKALRSNLSQLRKSYYIFFFQVPWLPEWLCSAFHYKLLERSLKQSSRPHTFSKEELTKYHKAWSQPHALTTMIHWYRAALQQKTPKNKHPKITTPTLVIWGEKDHFLGRELAELSIRYCEKGKIVFIKDATHWVQHEEAEQVNRLMVNFLR